LAACLGFFDRKKMFMGVKITPTPTPTPTVNFSHVPTFEKHAALIVNLQKIGTELMCYQKTLELPNECPKN